MWPERARVDARVVIGYAVGLRRAGCGGVQPVADGGELPVGQLEQRTPRVQARHSVSISMRNERGDRMKASGLELVAVTKKYGDTVAVGDPVGSHGADAVGMADVGVAAATTWLAAMANADAAVAGVYYATTRSKVDGAAPGAGKAAKASSSPRGSFLSSLEEKWDERKRDQP